jgi:hypothetical protein
MAYDVGNLGPGLGLTQKSGRIKLLNGGGEGGGHRGRDHIVVGFTTTYAISVYHH